ncbi:DUF5958 family protein [Streptomyces sp. NPDC002763]|uniref:DUF5958 family protein n=1 Tax=Streptomyces sp. NPDC002763 TaxID=3154427 RepID=UPI0033277C17
MGHQAAFLVQFCVQARATEADVPEAIARSGIRPTSTPAVMLTRSRSRLNMAELPLYDLQRAFRWRNWAARPDAGPATS